MTTAVLWTDLGGRVCCPKHLGNYATAALAEQPEARTIETPMTVWERMPKQEVADWLAFLTEHGETQPCEDCREGY